MQLSRRSLGPGEIDHELIWLAVSLGTLALAVFWFALGLPWPICIFHNLTGWPCLTCGATRAAAQFLHGNLLSAWNWNPLVFAVLCGLLVFDVYAAFVVIARAPRLRILLTSAEKIIIRFLVITALALNWIYLLGQWRNFS